MRGQYLGVVTPQRRRYLGKDTLRRDIWGDGTLVVGDTLEGVISWQDDTLTGDTLEVGVT